MSAGSQPRRVLAVSFPACTETCLHVASELHQVTHESHEYRSCQIFAWPAVSGPELALRTVAASLSAGSALRTGRCFQTKQNTRSTCKTQCDAGWLGHAPHERRDAKDGTRKHDQTGCDRLARETPAYLRLARFAASIHCVTEVVPVPCRKPEQRLQCVAHHLVVQAQL